MILHGKVDWVYGEEIWDRHPQAYWWSPDGRHMLEAIDHLPDVEREAFRLVRIRGLTQPEAAEVALKTRREAVPVYNNLEFVWYSKFVLPPAIECDHPGLQDRPQVHPERRL